MKAEHFYQCPACRKFYTGEDSFTNARHCCAVKEFWKCGECGKVYKTKNAHKNAANCCFVSSILQSVFSLEDSKRLKTQKVNSKSQKFRIADYKHKIKLNN